MGCEHYPNRECEVEFPCCQKWYSCHVCHDEQSERHYAKQEQSERHDEQSERHDESRNHRCNRYDIRNMRCLTCQFVQPTQQSCSQCEKVLSEYYCHICHLWAEGGNIWHCDKCGICRRANAPKEDFFHCEQCKMCVAHEYHRCAANTGERICSICLEEDNLTVSRKPITVFGCGHMFHVDCISEWRKRSLTCPTCRFDETDIHCQRILQSMDPSDLEEVKEVVRLRDTNPHEIFQRNFKEFNIQFGFCIKKELIDKNKNNNSENEV